jgi:hypothetical protein
MCDRVDLFIKDFCKIYHTARDYFNSLPSLDKEIIDAFDVKGRNNLLTKMDNLRICLPINKVNGKYLEKV